MTRLLRRHVAVILALWVSGVAAWSQSPQPKLGPLATRIGAFGGMGVSYAHPQDVVDVFNALVDPSERAAQFRAGVEFFGGVVFPLSPTVALKADYGYFVMSYNGQTAFGPADFTIQAHFPTLVVQYVLADEGVYNLKAGVGAGYHVGSLTEEYGSLNDRFTGTGLGTLLELEANTAFGENLFGYIGATLRWEFIGTLTDDAGKTAGVAAGGESATLQMFSAGVRFGMSYYF